MLFARELGDAPLESAFRLLLSGFLFLIRILFALSFFFRRSRIVSAFSLLLFRSSYGCFFAGLFSLAGSPCLVGREILGRGCKSRVVVLNVFSVDFRRVLKGPTARPVAKNLCRFFRLLFRFGLSHLDGLFVASLG
jgi:hypothetical protein